MFSLNRSIPLRKEFKHLKPEQIAAFPAEKTNKSTITREDLYYWDKSKERATRGFGSMDSLNQFLNETLVRAEDIVNDFAKRKKALTADSFRKAFKKTNVAMTFYEYCNKQLNEDRSDSLAKETIKSYMTILSKLDRYKPGVAMEQIDFKFLNAYANWMRKPKTEGGGGNCERTVNNNLKVLRTLMLLAIKNDDLMQEHYPFKEFKVGETVTELTSRDFLEPEEILQLEQLIISYYPPSKPVYEVGKEEWKERARLKILNPGEYQTLRYFLFACYTGLRFSDIMQLNIQEHIKGKYVINPLTTKRAYRLYIDMEEMHKTGKMLIVPLIDKTKLLLDMNKQGLAFDVISNQKTNKHLKFIAKTAGINKNLSFHVARHSFATTCFTYGIPDRVGQKLLGHKSAKFIEIYAHLTQNRLFVEMDKVNKGFNEYEQLLRIVHKDDEQFSSEDEFASKMKDDKFKELIGMLSKLDKSQIEKATAILKVVA
jgi:integrase